jgi:hypothetical protein
MKNLFLSLVLVMASLVTNSQNSIPSHIKIQDIEKEFMSLYQKRCDSLSHKISVDNSLLCVVECQLNYLKNFDDLFLSHRQEKNPKFLTLIDRVMYFYPNQTINYHPKIGEVCALLGTNDYFLKEETNVQLATQLFNNFMKSPGHQKIMDDKDLVKVCFKVGFNKTNSVFIVGVLSEKTLN